jgi:hypothetical protein
MHIIKCHQYPYALLALFPWFLTACPSPEPALEDLMIRSAELNNIEMSTAGVGLTNIEGTANLEVITEDNMAVTIPVTLQGNGLGILFGGTDSIDEFGGTELQADFDFSSVEMEEDGSYSTSPTDPIPDGEDDLDETADGGSADGASADGGSADGASADDESDVIIPVEFLFDSYMGTSAGGAFILGVEFHRLRNPKGVEFGLLYAGIGVGIFFGFDYLEIVSPETL